LVADDRPVLGELLKSACERGMSSTRFSGSPKLIVVGASSPRAKAEADRRTRAN
jgi:hypothetical protein